MDWEECRLKRITKDVSPDHGMIRSLRLTSENKSRSEQELRMSDVTAVSKLSLAYDSLRELLEALALKDGYKIYNHECYTAFLKEVKGKSSLGDDFDDVRKVRNAVNYYGKRISTEDASIVIEKMNRIREEVLRMM